MPPFLFAFGAGCGRPGDLVLTGRSFGRLLTPPIMEVAVLRHVFSVLVLSGCSSPPEQPELVTYGAALPFCLVFCHAAVGASGGAGDSHSTGAVQTSSSYGGQ